MNVLSGENRRRLSNLLKLVVGVGLLYFLYTKLQDPAGLWQQVRTSNKSFLLAALVAYAAAVAMSGLKWGILLRAVGISVPLSRLLAYQWVAEFFNNFLPAQVGGDVMRGFALASDTHRRADAAASVLIDRFLGLLVFMLSAAAASSAMLLFGRPDGSAFTGDELLAMRAMSLGSVAISLVLVMVLTAMLSRRLKAFVERILARLPLSARIMPIWHHLADAFNAYRHQYRALGLSAAGSLVIVALTSVQIWLIAAAIQPGAISLLEVLVINPIIVLLLVAVPLSPGGLGVRQGAFSIMFYLIGAGSDLGYAVGLLQQFIVYLVSVPGGLIWIRGRR
ncbi:MAG: flippase-like domain-containing protein [Caldilineaceae bacterium]|nr:flippase-like domain-containing protein [Caldilineaceae bacterium]MCB9140057.1 flippase-like domain-containing protein [Caldilineaceae bacterium]